jgi:ubiquinone biosynthesis protein COQ9
MPKKTHKSEADHLKAAQNRLLDAALAHVPFDGWSDQCFQAAQSDSGIEMALARQAFPRGIVDVALAYHQRGDQKMVERAKVRGLTQMRYSQRVAALVRFRLEAEEDREITRRGVTFFAVPAHAGEGASAIWRTCDLIWNTLGDTSDDLNWYSKRAILSAVYSSTLLFWLGDNSEDHQSTWEFLDRRIENVMQFEKLKGGILKNPAFKAFSRGPGQFLARIKAPASSPRTDMPGYVAQD